MRRLLEGWAKNEDFRGEKQESFLLQEYIKLANIVFLGFFLPIWSGSSDVEEENKKET